MQQAGSHSAGAIVESLHIETQVGGREIMDWCRFLKSHIPQCPTSFSQAKPLNFSQIVLPSENQIFKHVRLWSHSQ